MTAGSDGEGRIEGTEPFSPRDRSESVTGILSAEDPFLATMHAQSRWAPTMATPITTGSVPGFRQR